MITSLAYIGFSSPAADEWRSFGPEVLGAQLVPRDDAVALRVDSRAERIMVHPGDRDGLDYIGWDCGDAAGLVAAKNRVEHAGFALETDAPAAALRNVDELVAFTDPFGFRHELTHGLAEAGAFNPGREMSGFLTGDQGLGHIVLLVPDIDAATDFYQNTLGFILSDYVEAGVSLRFFHCNARHHTLALSQVPGMAGIHHLMLEVNEFDDVGRALDMVNERDMTLAMSLGRHTNDLMTSFYVRTPSGFEIEYGAGGREVDDATWQVETYDATSLWGHKPPGKPLFPGILHKLDA